MPGEVIRPSIMIVEDDAAIREVYLIKFELEGHEVQGAENGKSALSLLSDFHPDVILLDMMMPVMDGLEFMRQYRTQPDRAQVIVFSNMSAPDKIKEAMRLGAVAYWVKSDFTPELVIHRIRDLWQERH